jgi:hypothetical protein
MSRLEILITGKVLWHTGDIRLWADIDLELKDGSGNWHRRTFRVDTASDLTTMGAHEAKQLGLPIPRNAAQGAVHQQTGLEIRSGVLRFRIDGLDPTEYATACLFLGDPDTPPDPSRPATLPRKLLQPFGLLERLRFTLDKDPASGTMYGTLAVEKK